MDMKDNLFRLFLLFAFVLAMTASLSAQSTFAVFPQVVDGRSADGTSYRSTLMIVPWFEGDSPQCTFALYGMTAKFADGASVSNFPISVPTGGSVAMQSTGTQAFQSGYGTLSCSVNVFASLIYSFYASDNTKLGEATVFSSNESVKFRLTADQREGARFGVAIANNTSNQQGYLLTFSGGGVNLSATISVPPQRAAAKFLDEVMSLPANAVGVVTISSPTLSNFSVIGLRFTGGVFTTIPPS
jgi:hypothetical protein